MALDSYVTLGRSGLRISPFTLGAMTFGDDHGWGASPEESTNVLAAYLDRGGNSIDTANMYTNGHSEKIIGDYFAQHPDRRDRVVIGTKFFGNLHVGDPNGGGVGRKGILHQLEDSLRRLRTDYVDIYWVHNYDPATPIEETLRTLDNLVSSGKVRYIGLSDLPAFRVAQAAMISRYTSWAPITALQLEYSLLERTSEGELLPAAAEFGIGVLPWSPLKNGFLAGRFGTDRPAPESTTRTKASSFFQPPTDTEYRVIDQVNKIAADLGVSSAAVALSWVQGRPGVSSTLIGARRVEQLLDNVSALDLVLPDEQRAALDEISAPQLAFPAWANHSAGTLQFGGTTVDGQEHQVFPMLA
ncbi:MAG TPA: aldo/keto reductase, partial [Pseudonocardiaceae bacterium]|nr:aldo/keto reductase [Pseudonocardiaceae bacterium]